MNTRDLLRRLASLGTAQNRKVYARHGVPEPMFGVSFAHLDRLQREFAGEQTLAEGLWSSGNHDARVLACKIADPAACKPALLKRWMKEVDSYVLSDAFASLVAKTSQGAKLAATWRAAKGEWPSSVGWNATCALVEAGAVDADEARALLGVIEERIHAAPNRTRYSMNNALIAIGAQGGALARAATAAAKRIGKVEVDHGETSCKTPDAVTYIAKVVAHRKAKATKRRKA